MDKWRVRVGKDHNRNSIIIEVWDEEYQEYNISSIFPIENFSKNEDLAQILVNRLHNILNVNKNMINFMYNEVEGGE